MSHDITARSKLTGERISYITIKAFNQSKSWILYESLNCTEFNSGVSGNGRSKSFFESDVKMSISKFKYLIGEPEKEIEFAVSSSKPCISASLVIKNVLRSIGSKNKDEDVKIGMDKESLDDVHRFLNEIQESGEIVIDFL